MGIYTIPTTAASVNAQVTIKTTYTPPVIDGIVVEGEYGSKIHSVDYSSDEFISEFDKDKSIKSDFYMTWDNDNLYMAWVVKADAHYPIDPTVSHSATTTAGSTADLGYMWEYSCVQFMLCTGAPDASKPGTYQTSQWAGNYMEAGLSVMPDGSSYKILWSKPVGSDSFTIDDWYFAGKRDETLKTTTYEVKIPWSKIGMNTIGDNVQFGLAYAVSDQKDFNIEPSICGWQDAILGGKNMDNGAVITLSTMPTDGIYMGQPLSNPDYNLSISAPAEYIAGGNVNVTITLNDIKAQGGYELVSFYLYYDAEKVEPVVLNDGEYNDEMSAFLTAAPLKENWESLCKLQTEYTRYYLTFLTTDPNAAAKEDGDFVITVPFKVKSEIQDDLIFWLPHSDTICADYDMQKYYGNGSKVTLTKGTASSLALVPDSGLTIDTSKSRLTGVKNDTSVSILKANFTGSVTVMNSKGALANGSERVGTGFVITNGLQQITVILLGDGNGDGLVDAKDYLAAKRAFLGSYKPQEAFLTALCVSGGASPTSKDYLMIKRHFLGTYNLYSKA